MDFSRQFETFDQETFVTPIHIIGAGATGSFILLNLIKLGIKSPITVYDFDDVEEHNLPNQLFGLQDVGKSKIDALSNCIDRLKPADTKDIFYRKTKVTGEYALSGIVIVATDTMHSRKDIYMNAVKNKFGVKLLIESRMAKDGGFIYILDGKNFFHQKHYEETLYSDDVAEVSACGVSQSVGPTAMMMASMIAWQVINFHNNKLEANCISISTEYPNMFYDKWEA